MVQYGFPRGKLWRGTRGKIWRNERGGLLRRGCCQAVCSYCQTGTPRGVMELRWRNIEQCGYFDADYFATWGESGSRCLMWNEIPPGGCYWEYRMDGSDDPIQCYVFLGSVIAGKCRWAAYVALKTSPDLGGAGYRLLTFNGTDLANCPATNTMDCSDSSTWPERGGANEQVDCLLGNGGKFGECEFGLPGDTWSW